MPPNGVVGEDAGAVMQAWVDTAAAFGADRSGHFEISHDLANCSRLMRTDSSGRPRNLTASISSY
jgi:hypothetical protein